MDRPYKIGITGSNNTGKTTLALGLTFELKKRGCKANFIYESARACPIGTKEKGTVESQLWILGKTMQLETLLEKKNQIVICDRTAVDIYGFGKFHYKKQPSEKNETKFFILNYMAE